jgi:hypothetical protein
MHDVFENYVKSALSSLKKDIILEREGKQIKLSFLPGHKTFLRDYYILPKSTIPPLEGKGKVQYEILFEASSGKLSEKGFFSFEVIKF